MCRLWLKPRPVGGGSNPVLSGWWLKEPFQESCFPMLDSIGRRSETARVLLICPMYVFLSKNCSRVVDCPFFRFLFENKIARVFVFVFE